jgi:uncharacterized protein (TIGR00255 family)
MQSMTAFSRIQCSHEQYEITWEIKTVNHRFLDIFFRLPESMRFLETSLRTLIGQTLSRGRVEVSLQIKTYQAGQLPRLNHAVVEDLLQLAKQISNDYQIANDVSVRSLLSLPNIWETNETSSQESLKEKTLDSFKESMKQLSDVRYQEGCAIAQLLSERAALLQKHVQSIKDELQGQPQRLKEKVLSKLELITSNTVDPTRVEQEIAILLMRLDIAEELDRLETHLHEIKKTIDDKGAIGRRLDFLVQELHRETNTISSKTDSKSISYHSIEMKVLIEQMREQIQNVE